MGIVFVTKKARDMIAARCSDVKFNPELAGWVAS
jgi:hypothetical protein